MLKCATTTCGARDYFLFDEMLRKHIWEIFASGYLTVQFLRYKSLARPERKQATVSKL